MKLTLKEMNDLLNGKCLPSDLIVGETLAEYLVRKFSDLEQKLAVSQREFRAADATIENLEAKCAALAAELSAFERICNEAVFITDEHYEQCPPEVRKMIRSLVVLKIPSYQAFMAEVRARELDSLAGVAETMLVKFSNQRCSSDMHEVVGWKMVHQQASNRAAQLRKGVQS
ncbi:hypothetical protein AAHD50_00890 [Enterobacter hormaechei]|uniref:Uncharacterized protein n=1 Tax=Enterobacter hormaechei TaxID=158836 RepID=A0AAP8GHY5_9ENTR|nr:MULTISPECIES: hypothetical protein [Enterobacter]CAE7601449.1 hypothetical protein AI2760V1_1839 [Enterobacter cloacae]EJV4346414.1 hypothetical protein [Enterobacter hormaechei]ELZ5061517.1 hypothetical protein [Enterobacter hormaechei]KJO25452.1 hypothetical protein SS01_21985 [Enterobacter hormaechei subsp. xiangfangensis]KJO81066.1 hypothetical protein SR86_21745 [Enterobacter hormaechei subsp. xiangfangensis]